ncbi:hypothetical protein D3C71_1889470 [compost metagenome]
MNSCTITQTVWPAVTVIDAEGGYSVTAPGWRPPLQVGSAKIFSAQPARVGVDVEALIAKTTLPPVPATKVCA